MSTLTVALEVEEPLPHAPTRLTRAADDPLRQQEGGQRPAGTGATAIGSLVVEASIHETLRNADDGRQMDPELAVGLGFPRRLASTAVVHDDPKAAASADSLGALAVTAGSHIHFGAGQYAPQTAAGRSLIAHELAHVAQQAGVNSGPTAVSPVSRQWESEANAVAAAAETGLRLPPVTRDPRGVAALQAKGATANPGAGAKGSDAKTLISSRYPHLASVLTTAQIAQAQRVLDARAKLKRLGEQEAPYLQSILSEDVEKREKIEAKMSAPYEVLRTDRILVVPTDLLLADDVRFAKDDNPREAAYRQNLYAQMTAYPVLVTLMEPSESRTGDLCEFRWGPGSWLLTHDGGLIRFMDLMRIEKFNIDYQEVLVKSQIEILGHMEKIAYESLSPEGKLEVDITRDDDFPLDPAVLDPAGHELLHMAALRDAYRNGCKAIYDEAHLMIAKGKPIAEVADWAVAARNELKREIRDRGPGIVKVLAEARNIKKYGNKLGPTAEELRAGGRTSEEVVEGVTRDAASVTRWAGRLRIAGRILIAIDIGIAIYKVASAPEVDRPRVLLEEVGAISGALGGAALGAKGGAYVGGGIGGLFGPEAIPVGAAIGGFIGGVGGAIGGAWAGRKAANWVVSELYPPAETRLEGDFQ